MSTTHELEEGYDVILQDAAKGGLVCSECNFILRDAVQTSEGNRLCLPCFKKIEKSPGYISKRTGISVLDEEEGKPVWYPDKAVRREVVQLPVKCHNIKFECPWIGPLVDYFETHRPACKFKPTRCSNEGCKELVLSVKLKKHLELDCLYRNIKCEYCGEQTKPIALKGHHEVCNKFPLTCAQCDKQVPRDEMDDHNIRNCPKVVCNCGIVLLRDAPAASKDSIEAHLNNPTEVFFHIISVSAKIDKLEKTFSRIDTRLAAIENSGIAPSKNSTFVKELNQVRSELQTGLVDLNKRLEPIERYQADTATVSKDKNMSSKVSELQKKLKILEEKNSQQGIQIHTLQTQLQQRDVTTSLNIPSGSIDSSRLVNVEKRYEELDKQVSLLKVHISELELQLQASLASTHNGSFLWRIPDILRRRRDAIEERITSIYSPPFYTGRNGYKMCIRAYLNGDGMGYKTHLSLFFVVMKGEFDALLKWPFDYKVSLILVDQNHRKHIVQTFKPTPESNSFQRPVSDMNVASGCPQFAKLSVLDDPSYVKDDVLFVKCIVDTTRIFHP